MKNSLFLILTFIMTISTYQSGLTQLPTQIPSNLTQLEADNLTIATAFAPTIHQMATTDKEHSVKGFADLITSVLYDDSGYPNTRNNWESLDNFAYVGTPPLTH